MFGFLKREQRRKTLDRSRNTLGTHGQMCLASVVILMAHACDAKVVDCALVEIGMDAKLTIVFKTSKDVNHGRLQALIAGELKDAVLQIYGWACKPQPNKIIIVAKFP